MIVLLKMFRPMPLTRRKFLTAAAVAATPAAAQDIPDSIRALRPMTSGITPISGDERHTRIEKGRRLMHENHIDALVLEPGSSMFYFTGTRWGNSERTF